MKPMRVVLALTVAAVVFLSVTSRQSGGADPGTEKEMELTRTPALLLSPTAKVDEMTVYGVKLGDPVTKIPGNAGVARQPSERAREAVYTGRNVWFFAFDDKIYRIRVIGDTISEMPPYDTTRLQIALGRAEETDLSENGVTALSYFSRHIRFTYRQSQHMTAVDLYAP